MEREQVACSICGGAEATEVASGRDYIYHGSDEYFSHVGCNGCGHIYLASRPTPREIGRMYPGNYGTFSNKFRGRINLLAFVKNVVNLRRFNSVAGALTRGARILDVGCGNGQLLRALATRRPDLELHALDWHFPADTRTELERAGINLIEARLEHAPLPDEYFDLVLLYQVIEHLWVPELCLRSLRAALKIGGRIAIETPNTDGYDRTLFRKRFWGGYYVPRHLNLYNFARLERLLGEAGLHVVTRRSLPAPIIWCYSFQSMCDEMLGSGGMIGRIFSPSNFAALGAFAMLDMLAILIGQTTSNQQTVAERTA